jgi:predicted nucleic acid-binding protein
MTATDKIYVDTAPFIYLIEDHPVYYSTVELYLSEAMQNGASLATSTITLAEFGVQPQRIGRLDLIQNFKDLIRDLNVDFQPVNEVVAEISYKLRATHPFLRPMDALHLATSIHLSCQYFLTNDLKLKQITEMRIVILEELG